MNNPVYIYHKEGKIKAFNLETLTHDVGESLKSTGPVNEQEAGILILQPPYQKTGCWLSVR